MWFILVISSLKPDRFQKPVRFIPLILLINGRCLPHILSTNKDKNGTQT